MVLYIVDRGEVTDDENDLPEADLLVAVGKSNENGTVTKISELISGNGNVKSRVVAMPE